jgi:hypothetical protein
MAAVYPATIATIASNKQDDTDSKAGTDLGLSTTTGDHAAHHNQIAEELVAVQTELGTDPSGTFSNVAGRLNARLTCRKTADQTISSTVAPTNITDLLLPISTTALDYFFRFIIVCTSSAGATNGIRVGITCPALTGYVAADVTIPRTIDPNPANGTAQATPTVTTMPYVGQITSSGDSVVSDIVPVGVNFVVKVEGILSNPSATGNIQLQVANEVTTASGNVVKRGSYGELYIN